MNQPETIGQGRVLRVSGTIIDVQFEQAETPPIFRFYLQKTQSLWEKTHHLQNPQKLVFHSYPNRHF